MIRRLWPLLLLVFITSLGPPGLTQPIRAAEQEPAAKPDPEAEQAKEYFRQGVSAAKVGAYEEAIRWYKAAASLKPEIAPIHISLGYAYEKVGQLPDAEAAYREAIRLQPGIPPAYVNLGNVLESQGKVAEAEKAYIEALRLHPKFARAHNNLAWLWVSSEDPAFHRPKEALAHAEEAVRLTERMEAGPLDTLAEIYYQLDRCFDAIQTETEAVVEDPRNAAYKTSLKRFQLCQDASRAARDGDVAKARSRWQEILSLDPKDWRAKKELGRLP